MVLQGLVVVALGIIYPTDIVVGEGCVWMFSAKDFLLYRQSLLILLQCLAAFALVIIRPADIVV